MFYVLLKIQKKNVNIWFTKFRTNSNLFPDQLIRRAAKKMRLALDLSELFQKFPEILTIDCNRAKTILGF